MGITPGWIQDYAPHWVNLPQKDREEIELWVDEMNKQRRVAIHAVAQNDPLRLRDWGVENWAEFIKLLIQKRYVPLTVGSKADEEYYDGVYKHLTPYEHSHVVDWVGSTEFHEIPALLKTKTRALVCVNSSIMHLAIACQHPMVAVIGGTPAHILVPPDPTYFRVIEDEALKDYDPHKIESLSYTRIREIKPERAMELLEELR